MTDEKNNAPDGAKPVTTEVTPSGMPSENYLVAEHMQKMPSLVARGVLYLVVLSILVGLAYSIIGTMDIVIQCPAVAKVDPDAVSKDNVLYMDVLVGNKSIGVVEQGMQVRYKFEAFPYADFGAMEGHVILVSEMATRDDTMGFVFHARGALAKEYFASQNKKYQIRPGMTAVAEMVIGRKSIFSVLVGKKR